jgi:predicted transcriptional regulator of viral defense system
VTQIGRAARPADSERAPAASRSPRMPGAPAAQGRRFHTLFYQHAYKTVYRFVVMTQEALKVLSATAAEQGGMVTSQQAARQGVEHPVLVHLAGRGLLRRIRRGVYSFALGRASSPQEDDHPRAVVSHASAAAIHDLGTIIPTLPELTTSRQAGRRDGIAIHTAPFTPDDWAWTLLADARAPVTIPARTIIDLWLADEETDYLEQAISQAFPAPERALDELGRALARRRRRVGRDLERRLRRLVGASL